MNCFAILLAAATAFNCFPPEIRTIGVVMPASIQPKARFDAGVEALKAAGLPGVRSGHYLDSTLPLVYHRDIVPFGIQLFCQGAPYVSATRDDNVHPVTSFIL